MGHSLDDYAPKRADEWINKVRRYFQRKNLIYSIEVDRYDDRSDDIAMNLLKLMSSGGMTLDVFISVKVYNASVERVMNGNDFGCGEVRFYEDVTGSGNWYTLAEFERSFQYQ